jgi:hypothetical protein
MVKLNKIGEYSRILTNVNNNNNNNNNKAKCRPALHEVTTRVKMGNEIENVAIFLAFLAISVSIYFFSIKLQTLTWFQYQGTMGEMTVLAPD